MIKSIRLFLVLAITACSLAANAQGKKPESTVLDGAYVPEHNPTRRVVPYPHLRQADVMWRKRIWQVVDLRQKINHQLYFPVEEIQDRKSLYQLIRDAILDDGSITAYGLGPTQDDDEFRYPLDPATVDSMLNPVVIRYVERLDGSGEKDEVPQVEPITGDQIVAYKLKEDWVFDKQRSERYVRIIGIAPVIEKKSESGEVIGKKELFWLYFPECRYVFANADVFNMHNDAQRVTFDDLFQKRMFNGYVVKEENVYNRPIDSYARGIDALLESERIKNDLFILEHDLWHY